MEFGELLQHLFRLQRSHADRHKKEKKKKKITGNPGSWDAGLSDRIIGTSSQASQTSSRTRHVRVPVTSSTHATKYGGQR
ncbi:hypothetical protein F2P81_023276 [Scophthalmus maximus]|uniref:Uncharacterized protein n=1 Tax=Scophthalmus maximus TaxID=52904 RepID=A0A6A4S1U3_SCOMX|nr:hypothetical protein F2P81_023276 [Scophthalmus maximus]